MTQGAHGLNYHHKSPGDEGTTFFMPSNLAFFWLALRTLTFWVSIIFV